MMSLCSLIFIALAAVARCQMPPTLATPGPPPDVVAVFIGNNYVGSVNSAGAFAFSSAASSSNAPSGVYLSHTCNTDGSFDAVWSVDTYSNTGGLGTQTYYCEHGLVNSTTYQSIYQMGTTCPLTSYASAATRNLTELADSNMGALLMTPYCNSGIPGSPLVHANAAVPVPAPGPDTTFPSPGTVSVSSNTGSAGGTGVSGSSAGNVSMAGGAEPTP